MFGVFEKSVLDILEQEYLNYSKSIYDTLEGDPTHNFQSMLRTICKIPKVSGDSQTNLIKEMQVQQNKLLMSTINNFLDYNKIIKYGNPSSYFWLLPINNTKRVTNRN
jgi:hypothetical protein